MYDNATKETWRGWAWNQIRERLGKSSEAEPKRICVLAGDIAGDLPKARKHGFQCIGIDLQKPCVNVFRDRGGVAIQDSLHHQVVALQPHGLIADMLCGVTPSCIAMMTDSTGICDAMVFNFLRGRDRQICELTGAIPHYKGRFKTIEKIGKHRGRIALVYAAKLILESIDCESDAMPDWIFDLMRPAFYSYRSKDGGQYFDSVAITSNWLRLSKGDRERIRQFAPLKSRQKAAAAKALLTMRY